MAAQIVSGVGFLGAGLIFVRRDSVRGLTTAAAVWVTAAVGAACGAGLPILAAAATIIYLVVALTFPALTNHLPHSTTVFSVIRVRYPEGQGILREVLQLATNRGFILSEISTESDGYRQPHNTTSGSNEEVAMVNVTLQVRGRALVNDLVAALSELSGVDAVLADDVDASAE
jgi:putative Mg2+ transporter-C (MgtC) family protein